jgi:hypothetical protein
LFDGLQGHGGLAFDQTEAEAEERRPIRQGTTFSIGASIRVNHAVVATPGTNLGPNRE